MAHNVDKETLKQIARQCGFELAGVAPALPSPDYARFDQWVSAGHAGEMGYLTDHRADIRRDPRHLLPTARTILCVGKVYNVPCPHPSSLTANDCAWIARYAWGDDYHETLRHGLEHVLDQLRSKATAPFDARICVDTAPLLERSYAQLAGLGWIGRNTCLINQQHGSWFFLGELLLSLQLEPDMPPPNRCGSCRRCIDACPTNALIPGPQGWTLDSRLCISYLTIEKKGSIPPSSQALTGNHVFGCDICQEVCPWNRKASITDDPLFHAERFAPPLERLAALTEEDFRALFRSTAVWRTKYRGFLRNVAMAIGNSNQPELLPVAEKLARFGDPAVEEAAREAIRRLQAL